jgi:hypothetical protein
MRGVSKRVARLAALSILVLALGTQPASAAPQGSSSDHVRNFVRLIIRIFDETQISFPPG